MGKIVVMGIGEGWEDDCKDGGEGDWRLWGG